MSCLLCKLREPPLKEFLQHIYASCFPRSFEDGSDFTRDFPHRIEEIVKTFEQFRETRRLRERVLEALNGKNTRLNIHKIIELVEEEFGRDDLKEIGEADGSPQSPQVPDSDDSSVDGKRIFDYLSNHDEF